MARKTSFSTLCFYTLVTKKKEATKAS